jgi:hypothetical protein
MSKPEKLDAMLKTILAEQLKASGTFTPFIDKNTKANPFLEIGTSEINYLR